MGEFLEISSLMLIGIVLNFLFFSLLDDWFKYRFKLIETDSIKEEKQREFKRNKKQIKYQNRIINASIRTKI